MGYVTRHGGGKISVLSPTGQLLKELSLPNIAAVTNLAFGGVNGTTIYAVGRCSPAGWGNGDGCVDVVSSDYAGREWSWFRNAPEPTCELENMKPAWQKVDLLNVRDARMTSEEKLAVYVMMEKQH